MAGADRILEVAWAAGALVEVAANRPRKGGI